MKAEALGLQEVIKEGVKPLAMWQGRRGCWLLAMAGICFHGPQKAFSVFGTMNQSVIQGVAVFPRQDGVAPKTLIFFQSCRLPSRGLTGPSRGRRLLQPVKLSSVLDQESVTLQANLRRVLRAQALFDGFVKGAIGLFVVMLKLSRNCQLKKPQIGLGARI